jgi:hypothetical protein
VLQSLCQLRLLDLVCRILQVKSRLGQTGVLGLLSRSIEQVIGVRKISGGGFDHTRRISGLTVHRGYIRRSNLPTSLAHIIHSGSRVFKHLLYVYIKIQSRSDCASTEQFLWN